MMGRHRAVSAEESAAILRLHHAEEWPVGTIATQLGRHHDTIERVLAQSGLPVTKPSARARLVDPYLPFIHETLAKHPHLRASRLWSMVKEAGLLGVEERVSGDHQSAPPSSPRGGVLASCGARWAGGAGGLGALRQADGGAPSGTYGPS